ncbi:MAG TPA: STAS/SEC14 domain-containing protein [Methanothrix sp.]|nr:STAS/SEC14 domain-containing protein [Methanothrix sp.]
MFEKLDESSGNVIGFKAIGTITASDYQKLLPEVRALVEKEGNIRMLYDLSDFKWEKLEAWLPDLKFAMEFHNEIKKMAIVGDKSWEKWMSHLAKPFYARDAKFFHSADIAKAWAWLRE